MSNNNQSFGKCSCCGKPLSVPTSVELGIGPICRMSRKTNRDKSPVLFGNIAEFTWGTDGEILWIKDKNSDHRSVTNDAENVLTTVAGMILPQKLTDFLIIYQDSEGIWDEFKIISISTDESLKRCLEWLKYRIEKGKDFWSDYVTFAFQHIGEKSYNAAKEVIIGKYKSIQLPKG